MDHSNPITLTDAWQVLILISIGNLSSCHGKHSYCTFLCVIHRYHTAYDIHGLSPDTITTANCIVGIHPSSMDVRYTCYSVVKVSMDDNVTLYIHGLSLYVMGYSDKGVPVSLDAHNTVSCSDGLQG